MRGTAVLSYSGNSARTGAFVQELWAVLPRSGGELSGSGGGGRVSRKRRSGYAASSGAFASSSAVFADEGSAAAGFGGCDHRSRLPKRDVTNSRSSAVSE